MGNWKGGTWGSSFERYVRCMNQWPFQLKQKSEGKNEFLLPAPLEEEKQAPTSDAKEEECHERPLVMVAFVISECCQLRGKRRDKTRKMGKCLSPPGLTSQRQKRNLAQSHEGKQKGMRIGHTFGGALQRLYDNGGFKKEKPAGHMMPPAVQRRMPPAGPIMCSRRISKKIIASEEAGDMRTKEVAENVLQPRTRTAT